MATFYAQLAFLCLCSRLNVLRAMRPLQEELDEHQLGADTEADGVQLNKASEIAVAELDQTPGTVLDEKLDELETRIRCLEEGAKAPCDLAAPADKSTIRSTTIPPAASTSLAPEAMPTSLAASTSLAPEAASTSLAPEAMPTSLAAVLSPSLAAVSTTLAALSTSLAAETPSTTLAAEVPSTSLSALSSPYSTQLNETAEGSKEEVNCDGTEVSLSTSKDVDAFLSKYHSENSTDAMHSCRDDMAENERVAKAFERDAKKTPEGDVIGYLTQQLEWLMPVFTATCKNMVCNEAWYRAHRPTCVALDAYDSWCQDVMTPKLRPLFRNITGQDSLATVAKILAESHEPGKLNMSKMISDALAKIPLCKVCSTKEHDVRLDFADTDSHPLVEHRGEVENRGE